MQLSVSLDVVSEEQLRCRFNWQNGITGLAASASVIVTGISVNCTSVTASVHSQHWSQYRPVFGRLPEPTR